MRRRLLCAGMAMFWSVGMGPASLAWVGDTHAARTETIQLGQAVERMRGVEAMIVDAERAAAMEHRPTEEELARRLVQGQLMLAEHDVERAAIIFLDLLENHPDSQAAAQALYFLGEALTLLGMEKWASDCFIGVLGNRSSDAQLFHQRSVARLLDLLAPRREVGFARRPGLSATPEMRARMNALQISIDLAPRASVLNSSDGDVLVRWVLAIPPGQRETELRYAFGRWLFLNGRAEEATEELDAISPIDIPMSQGGEGAQWRVRAAYVSAAAVISRGEHDDAIARFTRIVRARPRARRDQKIVALSWMALGRIHHDHGEIDRAVRAYRAISRDSPFFQEAMYETAWTLLRGGRHARALQALDLLLVYDPDSPITAEIKQLRGKIKIRQRDWQGAEEEFLALRREFSDLATSLGQKLVRSDHSTRYFSAVVAEDMQHFGFDAIMPVEAARIAEALPRAVQGRELAQSTGELEQQLLEARTLLIQMQEAVQARERSRLFTDLGAHQASLDTAAFDLVELQEAMIRRASRRIGRDSGKRFESRRLALRRRVDEPLGGVRSRTKTATDLDELSKRVHKYDLTIVALRAQLIATERYYADTKKKQRLDNEGFLLQAAEMRDEIAILEKDVASLRTRVRQLGTSLRFTDPWAEARRSALREYGTYLNTVWKTLLRTKRDRDAEALWGHLRRLRARTDTGRQALDEAAGRRLARAIQILNEEEGNLDRYRTELLARSEDAQALVGAVMQAGLVDVVAEVTNLMTRAEVGLLDVAWAVQEVEAEQIHRLERERERDLRELDRLVEQGLGEGP